MQTSEFILSNEKKRKKVEIVFGIKKKCKIQKEKQKKLSSFSGVKKCETQNESLKLY